MQKEIRTYAELQKQMRDALREQQPDWVDPNGDHSDCIHCIYVLFPNFD